MNMNVRAVRNEDAVYINEMRTMHGVMENIRSIFSERISSTELFIKGLAENDHALVAEVEENGLKKVVGIISLTVNKIPRARHSGSIGIMIHKNYQGKGIGKTLFNKIIDLADNWLMLVRLELCVLTDNKAAISLYESLGFEIEGRKRYAAIRNGKYDDEYIMARYNIGKNK